MQLCISDPGERTQVADLAAALESVLHNHALAREVIEDVLLIAEEAACNAIDHGGTGQGERRLRVDIDVDGPRLRLSFIDDGAPFDPLAQPPPDLDAGIAERPIGGLGVHLIRGLAESVDYCYRDGCNHLNVVLRLPPPIPQPKDRP